MFPQDSISADVLKSLSYKVLINEVLLREAAILLIQKDLHCDRTAALKTRQRSERFGTLFHSGEDSPHLQAVIDKTTQAAHRQEHLFRQWKASDSTRSFKDWANSQEVDDGAAIKREEVVIVVPTVADEALKELGFKVIKYGDNVIYEIDD